MKLSGLRARARFRALLFCAMLAAVPACDDGPVVPPEDFLAVGDWNAVVFTATTGPDVYDLLELGGFISLRLAENGGLSGTYAVPAFAGQLGDEFEVAGTWTLTNRVRVHFEHPGDSYLRHLIFIGGDNQMSASGVIEGIDVHIVLER